MKKAVHRNRRTLEAVKFLRKRVEAAFGPDTAAEGYFTQQNPSSGQCAAVALIVQQVFGGELVSAFVEGTSHWFNRIEVANEVVDVDLTADQFGGRSVLSSEPGTLYPGTRLRSIADIRNETLHRARLLSLRAGLTQVSDEIEKRIARTPVATTERPVA